MAKFTVRVELSGAANGDGYEALNHAMEAQGFTRLIRIPDGRQFCLPTAEYRMVGQHTLAQVCRRAKAGAADSAGEAAILVTEGRCSWHNLRGLPA
jgi:hypothetical protein